MINLSHNLKVAHKHRIVGQWTVQVVNTSTATFNGLYFCYIIPVTKYLNVTLICVILPCATMWREFKLQQTC